MANAMGADFDKLIHVPYKGGERLARLLLLAKLTFLFKISQQQQERLKQVMLIALVVSTPDRQKIIADVPTAAEVGHPSIEMVIGWSAIYGPPGLPDDVVAKWVDTLEKLKKDAGWNKMTKSQVILSTSGLRQIRVPMWRLSIMLMMKL